MPKRKTLKQQADELILDIVLRQGPLTRPLALDLPYSSSDDSDEFYPEMGNPLVEYERTHFKGNK